MQPFGVISDGTNGVRAPMLTLQKGGKVNRCSGPLECDTCTLALPDCDVGQFSHSQLVRGPQPLVGCLPESCGRRGLEFERGEACGTMS